MKRRNQYTETKAPRTHSWQGNLEYDYMVSELSISSLRFLHDFYKKERRDFIKQFDIFNSVYQIEYMRILRIEGMISEEIGNRTMNELCNQTMECFDSEKGVVYDENEKELYSVALNELEDEFVYTNINTKESKESTFNSGSIDDETDYELYEPIDRNASYELWNYVSLIDEDN